MDPHSAVIQPYGYFYSNLVKMKLGYMDSPDGVIEGDLFESWELSPDKLQITGKINPKAQFAPVAPVNGRMVDAGDITTSWQRFSQIGSYRNELVNSVEPTAPILSLTSSDDRTIVIKIKEPFAPIFSMLAASRFPATSISSRRGAGPESARHSHDARGVGPWMIKEWRPSSDIDLHAQPQLQARQAR
jgi:peptide/nickel transport system substrate-binding protein